MQKAPIKNPEDPLNQNSEIILDSLAQASKESNVPLIDALLSSDLVIEADWEFRALTKHDLRFLALISAIQENRPHIALTICNSRQFHRFVVSSSSEDLYALFKQLAQERMRPHANVDLIYDCQIHILYKLSNSDLKNLLVEAIGHKDQHTIDLVGKFLILLRKKSDVLRADNKK